MTDNKMPSKEIEKEKLKIKKYLELENVSFLIGAGANADLGIPAMKKLKDSYKPINEQNLSPVKTKTLEDILNYLQAQRFVSYMTGNNTDCEHDLEIKNIQKHIFDKCSISKPDLKIHKMFLKKIMQRPVNLRRANIFTTNYDLVLDKAMDELGVHTINGFSGFHNRYFRPENFDYDLYYPGQTTTGKVHRAEKVIRYCKLHGSLSWVYDTPSPQNTYGIREVISGQEKNDGEMMIYPCVSKHMHTLALPYSELFRIFANTIRQPQSVLFCIGYSFGDQHINNIIYQALTMPSFTLFIIDIEESDTVKKWPNDPRIIKCCGEKYKFVEFVSNILPDIYEQNDSLQVAETAKHMIGNS